MRGHWTLRKRMEISAAHCLDLPYDSKCNNQHGHNYIVAVVITGTGLDECSMLMDFTAIKKVVMEWDHRNLDKAFAEEGIEGRSTAENMAMAIWNKLDKVSGPHAAVKSVTIEETEGNEVTYYAH